MGIPRIALPRALGRGGTGGKHIVRRRDRPPGCGVDHDRFDRRAGLAVDDLHARAFRREFAVPSSIDSEKVSASMKAGVLTVVLPKRAPYKPRQIAVRSS